MRRIVSAANYLAIYIYQPIRQYSMVEIVLVCCERQRTECRIRLKNNVIDVACEEKQYYLEFVTIYLMRLCRIGIYQENIYRCVLMEFTECRTQSIFISRNEARKGSYQYYIQSYVYKRNYIIFNTNYTKVLEVSKRLISRWFFVWDPPSSQYFIYQLRYLKVPCVYFSRVILYIVLYIIITKSHYC